MGPRVYKTLVKPGLSSTVRRSLATAKKMLTVPTLANTLATIERNRASRNASALANSLAVMTIPRAIEARGTVLSERNDIMEIAFTKKLMVELKDIYAMTVDKQWEFAGAVRCTIHPTDKNYVKFNTPTRRTDQQRMSVAFTPDMIQFKMLYHSHPSPRGQRSLATFPSAGDFKLYIQAYPAIQANLILDNEGIYVIDLIESVAKPDPTRAYAYFIRLLDIAKAPRLQIVDDIIIYKVDKQRWKSFINNNVDPIMRKNFGISIMFYFYSDIPKIRIRDPRPGVQ